MGFWILACWMRTTGQIILNLFMQVRICSLGFKNSNYDLDLNWDVGTWNLESGIGDVINGFWNLEDGMWGAADSWNLAVEIQNLESVILELRIWRLGFYFCLIWNSVFVNWTLIFETLIYLGILSFGIWWLKFGIWIEDCWMWNLELASRGKPADAVKELGGGNMGGLGGAVWFARR